MDGTRIRSLRKRMGLTQTQFAGRFMTTQVTVSRWERGEYKPLPFFRHALEQLELEVVRGAKVDGRSNEQLEVREGG